MPIECDLKKGRKEARHFFLDQLVWSYKYGNPLFSFNCIEAVLVSRGEYYEAKC